MSLGPVFLSSRTGTILGFNPQKKTIRIALNSAQVPFSKAGLEIETDLPSSWFGANGELGGMYPVTGSTVNVVIGQGGEWRCLGYANSSNYTTNNDAFPKSYFEKNKLAAFVPGVSLSQVENNVQQTISVAGIMTGNPVNQTCADPEQNIFSVNFGQYLGFSEASTLVSGIVFRDLGSNVTRNLAGSARTSHVYGKSLTPIGMDPRTTPGLGFVRNPPFVENREMVYEFAYDFGFTEDDKETELYQKEKNPALANYFDRNESRANTLNLNLTAPNFLIEQTKGTVVDTYGNVLDLNRLPLPVGSGNLSLRETEIDLSETFKQIRKIERKSIAYHFEINARKELPLPNLQSTTDYSRSKSRFSLDIDKEGQFKLNVPSSSPEGNVSLPVRYENYSCIKADLDDTGRPNAFIRNTTNQDIFVNSFGVGAIDISDEDQKEGKAAPIDWIKKTNIKLGTPYHNITTAGLAQQRPDPIENWAPNSLLNNPLNTPVLTDVVNTNIIVGGKDSNAGGRSGYINMDGFMSLSLGANTSDRQSLWIDYAGGVVANIGRDLRGRSYVGTMNGDLFLTIGGPGVTTDSRFPAEKDPARNGVYDGTLDIRVVRNGELSIFRIGPKGVNVATPGRITLEAGQDILISTPSNLFLNADNIYMYANEVGDVQTGRLVARKPKLTI